MRRIIQIEVGHLAEGEEEERLIALCDDGATFYLEKEYSGRTASFTWVELPRVPQYGDTSTY